MSNQQRKKQILTPQISYLVALMLGVVFSILCIVSFEDLSVAQETNRISDNQRITSNLSSEEIDKKISDAVEKQKEVATEKAIEKVRVESFDKVKGDLYASIVYPVLGIFISLFTLVILKDGIISVISQREKDRILTRVEKKLLAEIPDLLSRSDFSHRLKLLEIYAYWEDHNLVTTAMDELTDTINNTQVNPPISFDINAFICENLKEMHKSSRTSLYSIRDEISPNDLEEIIDSDDKHFSTLISTSCLQLDQDALHNDLKMIKEKFLEEKLQYPTASELTENLFTRQMTLLISILLKKNEYDAAEKLYKYMKEGRISTRAGRKADAKGILDKIFN
jgi:hypothetical protein